MESSVYENYQKKYKYQNLLLVHNLASVLTTETTLLNTSGVYREKGNQGRFCESAFNRQFNTVTFEQLTTLACVNQSMQLTSSGNGRASGQIDVSQVNVVIIHIPAGSFFLFASYKTTHVFNGRKNVSRGKT